MSHHRLALGGAALALILIAAVQAAPAQAAASGTFTATGSMSTDRVGATATLLANGTVLVIGQENLSPQASTNFETYAERYNPATGTWSDASNGLGTCNPQYWCRYESRAVLLSSGNALVEGGLSGSISAYSSGSIASAVLYDPATNSWTSSGAMTNPRSNQTATVLPDGQVLVAGGINYHHPGHGTGTEGPLASAELYTP